MLGVYKQPIVHKPVGTLVSHNTGRQDFGRMLTLDCTETLRRLRTRWTDPSGAAPCKQVLLSYRPLVGRQESKMQEGTPEPTSYTR